MASLQVRELLILCAGSRSVLVRPSLHVDLWKHVTGSADKLSSTYDLLGKVCLLMPSRLCYISVSEAVLCCAVVALVQLVRIQRRVPENGWTTQKVFHLLNAFVCILRCVVFALRDKVCCP